MNIFMKSGQTIEVDDGCTGTNKTPLLWLWQKMIENNNPPQ